MYRISYLIWSPVIVGRVGAINSMPADEGKSGLNLAAIKMYLVPGKARTLVGRREKNLLCDPQYIGVTNLGRRGKRKVEKMNGMAKNKIENSFVLLLLLLLLL